MTDRHFLGSLNRIVTLSQVTCEDRWSVMVTTALPALGKALYVLLVPSPDEILEEYLHPRTRRGQGKHPGKANTQRGRGRTGLDRVLPRAIIPDIDSAIAQLIPGREIFAGRTAGGLEKWIWTGIDVIDRGLWYWLLLDIGENFVHYWASNIMESRFCTNPAVAYFRGTFSRTQSIGGTSVMSSANNPVVHSAKQLQLFSDGRLGTLTNLNGTKSIFACDLSLRMIFTAPNPEQEVTLRILLNTGGGAFPIATTTRKFRSGETVDVSATGEWTGHWNQVQVQMSMPITGAPGSRWDAGVTVWAF